VLDDLSVFYHVSVQTIQFTCDGKLKINTRPPRTDEIRTLTKIKNVLFQSLSIGSGICNCGGEVIVQFVCRNVIYRCYHLNHAEASIRRGGRGGAGFEF